MKNPKHAKIIVKIPKIIFFSKNGTDVEEYTAGHLCIKFEEFILIYEAMIAINGFGLFLAVNYVKVTQLWCDSILTCRATYWMYIPSLKLISYSILKKSPENANGRTDGQTDRQTDGRTDIVTAWYVCFSNGHIKMKACCQYLACSTGTIQ